LDIAIAIARLRREKGLTQAELAKVTGLSSGYIAAIEQGRRVPRQKTLAIIVEKLGADIDGLQRRQSSND